MSDGNTMDSVLVTIGAKKGYTNTNGFVQFDSMVKRILRYRQQKRYTGIIKKSKVMK